MAPSPFTTASPHTPPSTLRRWLPFHLIAPITAAGDFVVITLACVLAGVGYHWLVFDSSGNVDEFVALGVLVSANFAALTMARQNYRPTNLINIGRQFRYTTLNWLFIFAILTAVAFTLKIATDFSRGATLSFFALGWCRVAGLPQCCWPQSETSACRRRFRRTTGGFDRRFRSSGCFPRVG